MTCSWVVYALGFLFGLAGTLLVLSIIDALRGGDK
jgi:high-affinity nickel permease